MVNLYYEMKSHNYDIYCDILSKFDITSNVKSHWVLEKALYKQNMLFSLLK